MSYLLLALAAPVVLYAAYIVKEILLYTWYIAKLSVPRTWWGSFKGAFSLVVFHEEPARWESYLRRIRRLVSR